MYSQLSTIGHSTLRKEKHMYNLSLIPNFELSLTNGYSVVVYNPDHFDEIAVIKCTENRTTITLLDDEEQLQSSVMMAFQDEEPVKFSIDNDVLGAILNRSSVVIDELIALLAYHQDIRQEQLDVLMEKIAKLSSIYAGEYIISEIRNYSEKEFKHFLETDDTLGFFKENI